MTLLGGTKVTDEKLSCLRKFKLLKNSTALQIFFPFLEKNHDFNQKI